ncbi:hypothetical protein K504DRAFT_524829 [Pleomassaria siparia CBS 279.74]|uniref:Uncharacterized protein n=1 Tax=Pleomassaria siparia CBS 279.74 TaxID=1314801 RepID=A0A6G1KC20_9PLEO|nr:hypothetical protein K504DRAFT_524829 [Pleomassaria siparia CBS 279.74]
MEPSVKEERETSTSGSLPKVCERLERNGCETVFVRRNNVPAQKAWMAVRCKGVDIISKVLETFPYPT